MATLYRKYRPQTFRDIVNQNHIKITLEQELATGKLAHAYLFCGPRGIGKTTLARVFAKALNCPNRKENEFEPCDQCENCNEITGNRSFDIIEIDAASHTGVDNVRENIIASSRISPTKSKYKIFIIDEVHMLSISAFNALLKILEEPVSNVVFILCTTEVHKIPATIISRCQRFDFRKIGVKDIVKRLEHISEMEEIKINKATLEEIARHSEGHMRDAESLLGQIISISGREVTQDEAALVIPRSDLNEVLNLLGFIEKKDASSAIRLINKIVDEGFDLKTYLNNTIEIARKILLLKINPALAESVSLEYGESIEIRIRELSKTFEQEKILVIIEELIMAKSALKDAYIIQLPIEIAIVKLCGREKTGNLMKKDKIILSDSLSDTEIKTIKNSEPKIINNTAVNDTLLSETNDDAISGKWQEVLNKIKKHNHSLSFILGVCKPKEISENRLSLVFKYKFHSDRINHPTIRGTIDKVINEAFGQQMVIDTSIDENMEIDILENGQSVESNNGLEQNNKSNDHGNSDMINDLLKTFGGRVIQ